MGNTTEGTWVVCGRNFEDGCPFVYQTADSMLDAIDVCERVRREDEESLPFMLTWVEACLLGLCSDE